MGKKSVMDLSVKRVVENDIISDIVCENDKIMDAKSLSKIGKKLDIAKSPWDFLLVVIDDNRKFKGIITYKEFKNAIKKIKDGDNDVTFGNVVNNSKDFVIMPHVTIREVLEKMKSKSIFVLVVVNKEETYVGKVRKTNIDKSLIELQKELK